MNTSGETIGVLVCTIALFSAVMTGLTMPTKTSKRLIGLFAGFTMVGALLLYGYGYGVTQGKDSFLAAVFRAVFASVRVFGGSNSWGDVAEAYPNAPEQILFWLVHLMGLFASAGAVVTTLGSGPLRRLKLFLSRQKNVALIYGLNARTLEFGRTVGTQKNMFVVYVDPKPDSGLAQAAERMGAICRSDSAAVQGNFQFLKGIGMRPGMGTVRLYALHQDQIADRRYARQLMKALEEREIHPDQTALTILGPEDETESVFQANGENYGYGTVISVNEPELAARMLVQTYPPCNHIRFRPDGQADSNFRGLIIGFGPMGQAVLRQLVMHGQFFGCDFRVDVFDPNHEQVMGKLAYDCEHMLEHYDIHFYPHDGRSRQMYEHISNDSDSLNYIVLCTGTSDRNGELYRQLSGFLAHRGCDAAIYLCDENGVSHPVDREHIETHPIYVPELLCTDQIDRKAMAINHYYTGEGEMRENWRRCKYFHRMSSRAAADFHPALLKAAGTNEETAKQHWAPEGKLLENLAITEHLRWMAFHYSMGFRPMTEQEMRQRAQLLQQGKATGKVNQDLDLRIHACMVPWKDLDKVSQLQTELSNKTVNHKQTDINSILTLADVLRSMDS